MPLRLPWTRAMQSDGVRDPKAATQLLTYASPGVRQIPEWDADSAIREAYLSSVIVYAAVQARAKALASCSLRAVLPGKDIADHNPNAPLAKLLGPAPGGPNPNLSARRLWANATANYIVTGKFAWELEPPQGASLKDNTWAPVRIWPLIARVFDVIPSDGGLDLFAAFLYGRGDRKVTLQPSQVFYTYNPSLNDSRQASSALQALRYDVLAEVMQSIYDSAFLRNDARPAGLIVHAAFEEASQRRAFEQQWDAQHRSPQNANRMAFAEFEGGDGKEVPFQFISLGLSQRDAQMLQTQQAKVARICMGLGVPLSMLDASGRTFNNGGLEAQNFWTNTVLWDIADFEDEINRNLAPRLGPEIAKFDTRHVEALKAPSKFASISVGDAVDRKILDPEEARTEMGYPQRDPDTIAAQQGNAGPSMTEQSQLVAALASAGWDAATIAKIVGLEAPPKEVETKPLQLPPGAIKVQPQPVDGSNFGTWAQSFSVVRAIRHESTRAAVWHAMDQQTRAAEGAWVKACRRLFARQRKTTLDRLESRASRWAKRDDATAVDPGEIFDPAFQEQQTADALSGLFETLLAASGSRVASQHGYGFDVNDPKIQALIDQRVSKLAEEITGTTYDAIRSVVISGIANGASIPSIAQGIEGVFLEADSVRAELIARTETIAASADGALASYQQGYAMGALDGYGKVWIAELDSRCDARCAALDGEVVPFDQTFSSGEAAPPDHPNCRCAIGAEPLDPSDRTLHADDVRGILHAIADGSLTSADLVA